MLFLSKYANYRIILKPMRYENVQGSRFLHEGLTVEFINGSYETKDQNIIDQLKAAKRYGLDFYTDSKEKDEPSREAIKEVNEEKEYIEANASVCTECGAHFKNAFALQGHMKVHKK